MRAEQDAPLIANGVVWGSVGEAAAEEATERFPPMLTTDEICQGLQKIAGALIGNGFVASEENVVPGPNPALAVALVSRLLRRIRESPVCDSSLRPLAS